MCLCANHFRLKITFQLLCSIYVYPYVYPNETKSSWPEKNPYALCTSVRTKVKYHSIIVTGGLYGKSLQIKLKKKVHQNITSPICSKPINCIAIGNVPLCVLFKPCFHFCWSTWVTHSLKFFFFGKKKKSRLDKC